jgi:hypothetical protein
VGGGGLRTGYPAGQLHCIGADCDRVPPAPPADFTAIHVPGAGNVLTWRANTEPDFLHYRVYRDTTAGFTPDAATLVYQTFDTTWTDPVTDTRPFYYKLTAVDTQFNESDASDATVATGAASSDAPTHARLYQNTPNPFNPVTVIRYDLPAGGSVVSIRVYDAAGRVVRTLVDGFQPGGAQSVVWDGRNDRGARAASGVYLCRLTTPGYERTVKMALVQ